jgi:hypothetical protein
VSDLLDAWLDAADEEPEEESPPMSERDAQMEAVLLEMDAIYARNKGISVEEYQRMRRKR